MRTNRRAPKPPKKATDHKWMQFAACKNYGPELFHSDDRKSKGAKSICADCAVKDDCLNYALEERIHEGVWGGMTGIERQSYRRRIARRRALETTNLGS